VNNVGSPDIDDVVRNRVANVVSGRLDHAPCPNMKFRTDELPSLATSRAGPSWVMFAGCTHASTVIAFDANTGPNNAVAGPPLLIAVDEPIVNPPPGTHDTLPGDEIVRSKPAGPESPTVDPLPSLKSYRMISPGVLAATTGEGVPTRSTIRNCADARSITAATTTNLLDVDPPAARPPC
jgi:hypothetical protein